MPELPDVEGFRRTFRRRATGKRVLGVACEKDIVRNSSPQGLGRAVKDSAFESPNRWGKWLICPVDGTTLLIHFGMTGGLVWSGDESERHPHDRLTLAFSDGELRYRNQRKLGGIWLARPDEVEDVIGPLGPDALKISEKDFRERLSRRRGSIKNALMEQKVLAGLGNLTVDESLWQARISPRKRVGSLSDRELKVLHSKVQKVLRDSSKEGLVPAKRSWLTGARDRDDARCPRCRTELKRGSIGGRATYWCSRCQ